MTEYYSAPTPKWIILTSAAFGLLALTALLFGLPTKDTSQAWALLLTVIGVAFLSIIGLKSAAVSIDKYGNIRIPGFAGRWLLSAVEAPLFKQSWYLKGSNGIPVYVFQAKHVKHLSPVAGNKTHATITFTQIPKNIVSWRPVALSFPAPKSSTITLNVGDYDWFTSQIRRRQAEQNT